MFKVAFAYVNMTAWDKCKSHKDIYSTVKNKNTLTFVSMALIKWGYKLSNWKLRPHILGHAVVCVYSLVSWLFLSYHVFRRWMPLQHAEHGTLTSSDLYVNWLARSLLTNTVRSTPRHALAAASGDSARRTAQSYSFTHCKPSPLWHKHTLYPRN